MLFLRSPEMRELAASPALGELIELRHYDEALGCYILGKDGHRLAQVLELGFVYDSALGLDQLDQVLDSFESIVRAVEPGSTWVQLLLLSREHDAEEELAAYDAWIDTSGDDVAHTLHHVHSDHYRAALGEGGFGGAGLKPRRLRLYAVVIHDASPSDLERLRSGLEAKRAHRHRQEQAIALETDVARIQEAIGDVPVHARRVEPAEVLELMRRLLTVDLADRQLPVYDPARGFAEQLGVSMVDVERDRLVVDGRRVFRVLSLTERPEEVEPGIARAFAAMPGEWLVALNFCRPRHQDAISEINNREAIASRANAFGMKSPESELYEAEASGYRRAGLGQGFVHAAFHVLVWGRDAADVERRVTMVTAEMGRLHFGLHLEKWAAPECVRQVLPGGYRPRVDERFTGRRLTYLPSQVVSLMPMLKQPRRLSENPDHVFLSSNLEPVRMSLFGAGAPHGSIVGKSGGGKSVLAGKLMGEAFRLGAPLSGVSKPSFQVVIDIRETYERFAEFVGGGFYRLGLDSEFCLNPFHRDVLDRDGEPIQAELAFQAGILVAMVEGHHDRLDRAEAGVLKEVLVRTNERFEGREKRPTLTDVLETFEDATFQERIGSEASGFGRRVSLMVRDFTRRGPYGRLIDGDLNLELGARDGRASYEVFNIAGLSAQKELQSLVVRALIYHIQTEVERAWRAGLRSYLWLDEVWNLLGSSEEAAEFLAEGFRAYRHRRAAIWCITQQPEDFDGPAGRTIRANSGTSIFLPMNRDQIGLASSFLDLDPEEAASISALTTRPGRYSQFFVRTADVKATFFYPAPPLLYWLFATDGDDLILLEEAKERTGDVMKACLWLAEHYPSGARGGVAPGAGASRGPASA